MQTTFGLRRQEIVQENPLVGDFLEKWPALRMESQEVQDVQMKLNAAHRALPLYLREEDPQFLERLRTPYPGLLRCPSSGGKILRDDQSVSSLDSLSAEAHGGLEQTGGDRRTLTVSPLVLMCIPQWTPLFFA
ncbi:hypothetical protein KUCAC02_006388 [Chaenocephalus aceratus]|uniref:Uncharacterized protein n=1 Tax=Chaenocephalus aceratus TaxID=36190 RepID=A0ACB9VSB2_CHAAC|nr:hypothetical protein KUCAC02_006388 [Chaenocephalus aceratus]